MPDGEFLPPVQYQPWWGLLGFLILVVVVGWYIWLFVSTRASKARSEVTQQSVYRPTAEAIRAHYVGLIGQTKAAHAAGQLDRREAHHQLSLLLRSYVDEREGVRTLHMTLKDLRTNPLTPLSDAVARL